MYRQKRYTLCRLSKNFVFVDVGAGAHTGPTVESPDFAVISHNLVTFVKEPMRASAPTNGFFDTLKRVYRQKRYTLCLFGYVCQSTTSTLGLMLL